MSCLALKTIQNITYGSISCQMYQFWFLNQRESFSIFYFLLLCNFESMYFYLCSLAKGSHKFGARMSPSPYSAKKKDSHPYWCFSICAPPDHNGTKTFLTLNLNTYFYRLKLIYSEKAIIFSKLPSYFWWYLVISKKTWVILQKKYGLLTKPQLYWAMQHLAELSQV